ncbi:hypothetical protein HYH03_014337 [Edaphochlamys debaryana]|uniref:Uncharacterized protein n=1 Tax=Edaphochlamys debaryana TaxID=47281 RepID=A0A836BTP5_9CHLO|nr:hypothetical protein HYH03_014337 [Edaphochlamys debaryana]|eukprot:KAG2487093.1 hypothetical protein HYH03_014337 [Edaphochlamys debaryana]
MSFAFKRFNFFQPQQVARHGFPPNASCVVPGGQLLWVGTDSGTVAVLNSRLSLAASFTAHGHRVLEVLWLERRQLLVTVGLEEPGCSSTAVKIWPAERLAAAAAAADAGGEGGGGGGAGAAVSLPALKTVKVFGSHGGQQYPESPVTAAAAAEGGGGGGGGAADGSTPLTVALGLASGHVVVLAGEVSGSTAAGGHGKARLLHSRRLSARPDSGDAWGVTGLELTGTSDLLSLFVVTESQTLCFHLQTNTKTVLDPQGCGAPRCCALRPPACQLLTVARAEGLYDYTVDTRAGCTVFEGPKQRLGTFGRYMVVVTRDDSASSAAPNLLSSAPGAGAGAGGAGGPSPGGSRGVAGTTGGSSCLQLADIRTKLLAGTFVLQGLQHVFCAWGAVHAVTAAGAIWSYREIDLASQLEALLRRSLHKLALDVARAAGGGAGGGGGAGADEATLANIHQRWGDHLYGKGEYDAAMTQYLETVGHLEPSYVIRRFLDAQRIHNLTAYLELMHERGLASADHTTLLLNCYTKLKDVAKLDAFLGRGLGGAAVPPGGPGAGPHPHPHSHSHTHTHSHTPGGATPGGAGAGPGRPRVGRRWAARGQAPADSHQATSTAAPSPASAPPALGFDADTAVRVLRGAGYAEHALWVADASGQVDCVLDVLLDDLGDAEEAIAYLETLPRRRRSEALRKYGRALIGARAEEATRLIMDLCCGVPEPGAPSGPFPSSSPPEPYFLASVSDFAHLYTGQPEALMLLCEYILHSTHAAGPPASAPGASPDSDALARERARGHERLLFHTLLELYLADALWGQGSPAPASGGGAPTPPPPAPGSSAALDAEARRSKALDLLARGWPPHALPSAPSAAAPLPSPTGAPGPPAGSAGSGSGSGPGGPYVGVSYDPDHALVLCRMHGFRQGLLFLYDRLRLPREALQVYMSAADYEGLISAVLKYGDAARGGDPVLWAQVLEYFVQQHDRDPPASDCSAQISRVVDHVERSGVLPPLVVLQALSRSRRLPLGLVRGYVARALQRDTAAVGRDKEAVTKLASETAALREEVTRLRTQPRVFQASRCSASGAPLELPVVHFLCGHSFNARQLGEQDRECPLCGPSQRHVLDIRRSMQASSLQPERFFAELREAEDGFAVVAEALGRGAMNVTPAAAAAAAAAVGAGPATLGP